MIVFDLECINGHSFEGWFEDGHTFEQQQEAGQVSCPVCDSCSVVQKLSAVAIRTTSSATSHEKAKLEAMLELTKKVSDYVEKNFDNVGSEFAKEALKIHYGASEPRNIRGITTKEEDKVLEKEGVPVIRLPLPQKSNEDLN